MSQILAYVLLRQLKTLRLLGLVDDLLAKIPQHVKNTLLFLIIEMILCKDLMMSCNRDSIHAFEVGFLLFFLEYWLQIESEIKRIISEILIHFSDLFDIKLIL